MKSNFFSTGLITLTALLSIKGASLLSDLYQGIGLKSFANSRQAMQESVSIKELKGSPLLLPESAKNQANTAQSTTVQEAAKEYTKVVIAQKVIPEYTQEDLKLFGSLSQKSKDLNEQQQNLDLKEAVLTAIENKISQKIQQIASQQQEMQKVMSLYDQKENAEIKSLANIYSNMKPRDAAGIFNELDMPLLIKIVNSMKERSVAQIIALMNHAKVKDLSIQLSKSRHHDKSKSQHHDKADAAS
jgi:flagellar motility protein MotE (MotC chaperone)